MSWQIYISETVVISHLILVGTVLTTATSNDITQTNLIHDLAFPSEIDAVVGEVIYFKIIEPVSDQTSCHYRITGGKDVDIKTPHKQNIEQWNNEICGIRISNITLQEYGFWTLTSSNRNSDVAKAIIFVNVRDEIPKQPTLKDIESFNDNISPSNTAYCYVLRPGETKTSFPMHETCHFPDFQSDFDGNGVWNVVAGVKGKTQELSYQVNVHVHDLDVEELQTYSEYDASTSSLNMKCKLINSKKEQKFCRFLRLNDDVGFHLEEGRGDERYRYFGNGLKSLECGISILNPDENDKSSWKCFIGVIDENGEMKTVGAIVDSLSSETQTQDDIETTDVYGLESTSVNILCKRNIQTDYCWFQDPSGQKISLSDQKPSNEDDTYRYYGTGIKLGECGLTISSAQHNHSGTWSCHLGATHVAKTDTMHEISVRIAESPLVALTLFQEAQHGTSLLLECRSIPEHIPIDYCRFVLPDGTGFSVNEKTTVDNPHMNNYYFNPNRQMKSGYCSIVVKKIDRFLHSGTWICAARLTGSNHESFDEFRVTVFESSQISASIAQITGMAIAAVFLIMASSFVTYKSYLKKRNARRTTHQTVVTYISGSDRVSLSSTHSNDLFNIRPTAQDIETIEMTEMRTNL